MPHRAWRIRRGAFDAVPTDRLTAERLASFLSFLGTVSPESSTQVEAAEAPPQTPVAEPTPPDVTALTTRQPATTTSPSVVPPTVYRPSDLAVSDGGVSEVVVPIPAATEEETSAISAAGRHRSPSSPRWTIRGFGLTSRRLQILGGLAVVLAAAVVYFLLA
jgi:hypothetical protein